MPHYFDLFVTHLKADMNGKCARKNRACLSNHL